MAGLEKSKQGSLMQTTSGTLSRQGVSLTVSTLEQALLVQFPKEDAEAWDKTGMTVGDPARLITGVAVALDPTPDAVREAAARGANVLVTHHPAFLSAPDTFSPGLSVATNAGALVWAAISHKVALLSYHTSLDVSERAQYVLPGMLNLTFSNVVVPLASTQHKGYGQMCSVATTDAPLTLGQLAARCTSVFARPPRVWGDFSRELVRVVTCTGSAGEVAQAALSAHADCLVCGEIKYHDALALSQAGLAIVELGHDTSELPLAAVLCAAIESAGVPSEHIEILDQGGNWTHPETMRV